MKDEDFVDFHTTIARQKANLPLMQELAETIMAEHALRAKVMKSSYDALIEAGFNKDQALDIVKSQGWLGK